MTDIVMKSTITIGMSLLVIAVAGWTAGLIVLAAAGGITWGMSR